MPRYTTLPHIKLAHVAAGQAEVRRFTPFSPAVTFGSSESLGWVVKSVYGRWVAQDTNGVPLAYFDSRREAVDYLATLS